MKKLPITNYKLPIRNTIAAIFVAVFSGAVLAADVTPTAQAAAPVAAVEAAPAAGAKAMTFDDCYKLASEKNRDYRIAKLDKAISEAQLAQAAARFGPTVSAVGQYEPIFRSPIDLSGFMIPGLTSQNYYTARISLSQPIFTFGKTVFAFKIAEEGYKIAKINFKKAGEKLNLDVISAFYGALITRELANAQAEALKASDEYLRITKTKYKNGQASNFDVLQAQVQYSNSIPDAKKAQDGAMLAMQNLKSTLGLPMDEPLELSGTPEYKKMETAYADIKRKFTEKNDDRDMVEAAANIAGYARNLSIAGLLPNVGLTLNYTMTNANKDFTLKGSDWYNSWDGSIGVQWAFFDGFKNVAAIKEAESGAEKAEINREKMDNLLEIQLDQLYTSLEQSSQIIEAADEVIKQANEGYRIAKESYKNGLIQSVDLLNAETGLLRAKTNYLNAMLNYTTTMQTLKNFIE